MFLKFARLFSIGCFFIFFSNGYAQKYSLKECEQIFLKNNLLLLSEKYNIDAAEALTIQAGLWDNINFSGQLNAINPRDKQTFFNVGDNGQKTFTIQQVIHLGGQKDNEVAIAKTNSKIAKLQFKNLLRNLKFELRKSYYTVLYNFQSVQLLDEHLIYLDTLIGKYFTQYKKGNIPSLIVVRLQSSYVNIQNDRMNLVKEILQEQEKLKILLNYPDDFSLEEINEDAYYLKNEKVINSLSIDSLQRRALKNRLDLFISKAMVEASELNVRWQQSLIVPDLTLGATYDQQGQPLGRDIINLNFSLSLPFWNVNQGNIGFAEAKAKQSAIENQSAENKVKFEVVTSYRNFIQSLNNFKMIYKISPENFKNVYQGVQENFTKKNISLIEYTDFVESYNKNIIQFNEFKKKFMTACDEINFITNSTLFENE